MKPILRSPGIDRRAPTLVTGDASGAIRLASFHVAVAQAQARSAAVLEQPGATKTGDPRIRLPCDAQGGPDFVPWSSASPPSTTTAHVGRAADVRPACLRARSGEGARTAESGLEGQTAVQGGARRRHEGARRLGRKRTHGTHDGNPCRHDHRRFEKIVSDWLATARDPPLQPALHRAGVPADAGAARLSARQRLQDLHRLGRRHRIHAPVDRRVYGVPPSRSSDHHQERFEMRDGKPILFRLPEINFIDDGRQAGRHQRAHRPPPDRRVRQLRRRPRDAAMDHDGRAARASA